MVLTGDGERGGCKASSLKGQPYHVRFGKENGPFYDECEACVAVNAKPSGVPELNHRGNGGVEFKTMLVHAPLNLSVWLLKAKAMEGLLLGCMPWDPHVDFAHRLQESPQKLLRRVGWYHRVHGTHRKINVICLSPREKM